LGDGLCIAAEDIIENSGTWSANVKSWYSFKQNSIGRNQPITGTIPAESTQTAILTSCFTNCCAALGVCTPPTIASVARDTATCTNGVANANARVMVRGIVGMAKYAFGTNGTTGLFANTAIASTADSIRLNNLTNPATARTYTFRIWKTDTTCYNDTTVILPPSVCPIPCTAPTLVRVAHDTATCNNGTANSDAAVAVRGIVGMAKYAFGTNGTTGLFANTAIASTADSIRLNNLTNPATARTYTFRIWATDTTCFNDTTVILLPSVCFSTNVVIDSVVNHECDPYQSKWLAKVYFHYSTPQNDTLILNGKRFPVSSGTRQGFLFCGLLPLNTGNVVFTLMFASDTTVRDTTHLMSPTACTVIDPIGFFYCSQTGRIVKGVDISVSGSGNVTYEAQGCLGRYQWLVDAPGLYTMSYTLPPGYTPSTTCLQQNTVYDPPTNMGDTVFLGNNQNLNNPRFLTSNACTPFYTQFQLDVNDPIIAANNIAVNCNCDTTTTILAPNQTHTLTAEASISNIVWQRDTGTGFFNLPTNSDGNGNEHSLIVSTRGTYRYEGTMPNGCPYESPCEHKFNNAVDLTLDKSVNTAIATQGANVVFTIKVKNQSLANATGVTVRDSLPVGMSFVSAMPNGAYNTATKLWTIGNLNAGDSTTLTMTVRLDSVGVQYNTAEIHTMNETETDSSPNNQSPTEDDIDRVCVSVPIPVCISQGKTLTLTLPSGLSNIKWFRNGTEIGGQTANTLIVNQIGDYTFTADQTTCPIEGCCPVKVVEGNCAPTCKPVICLPVTVSRF
jgi:uncharacterized repeat protein (TIGR01451 family)